MIYRLRLFHAAVAILVLLAYVTGDDDTLHYWLGYGVAAMVSLRVIWGLMGIPQLGLMKYYPHFDGLRLSNAMTHPAISRTFLLAIAVSVIVTVATGIAMDQGRALGLGKVVDVAPSAMEKSNLAARKDPSRRRPRPYPHWLEEVHEVSGNLVLVAVALHVTYLLIWKRPLALFMLFLGTAGTQRKRPPARPEAP